jgi:hypothetical protein
MNDDDNHVADDDDADVVEIQICFNWMLQITEAASAAEAVRIVCVCVVKQIFTHVFKRALDLLT